MVWVKDDSDRYVNIDAWDFLDYQSLEDSEINKTIAFKIYLSDRNGKEYPLGYLRDCDEDIIKQITLGFEPFFQELEDFIYYYLEDEFDKDPSLCGENFEDKFQKRHNRIKEIFNKRFFYTP